jgi:hypothetical protein
MPTPTETQFPLAITILCYCGVFLLILILFVLLRINSRIAAFSAKLNRSSRSTKLAEPDAEPQSAEVELGTPFNEFLNEDSQRRSLSKKEQFKAYRKWRKEKGLNWVAKE